MSRRTLYSTATVAISLTFLFALFTLLLPLSVAHAAQLSAMAAQDDGQVYVVQAGDSLYKIASEFYGNGNLWPTIEAATNEKAKTDKTFLPIRDPKLLRIGQKLWIPNQSTSSLPAKTVAAAATEPVATTGKRNVRFVSPTNQSTVSPTFQVVMAASGVKVEPAGEVNANSGHMHILIDEDFVEAGDVIINDDSHLHYGKGQLTTTLSLTPGSHVLRLQFADGAHMALDDSNLRNTITVTVAAEEASAERRSAEQKIHFVSPTNGAIVSTTFQVEMAASGVTIEPAGEVHENAGHMHILVDDDFVAAGEVIINDDTHLHYGKGQLTTTLTLEPGIHQLRLQLGDGAHMALDDTGVQDEITVIVAAGGNDTDGTSVHFVSPSDGDTVSTTFEIVMEANGVTVEPAGEVHENAGHMHILVDDDFVPAGDVIINDETHLHFGKGQLTTTLTLDPGVHILRLQLADGAHMALDDPRLQESITITVTEDQ